MGPSLRAIAREMDIDVGTVKRYLNIQTDAMKTENMPDENLIEQYRSLLLKGMKLFPNYSRTQWAL